MSVSCIFKRGEGAASGQGNFSASSPMVALAGSVTGLARPSSGWVLSCTIRDGKSVAFPLDAKMDLQPMLEELPNKQGSSSWLARHCQGVAETDKENETRGLLWGESPRLRGESDPQDATSRPELRRLWHEVGEDAAEMQACENFSVSKFSALRVEAATAE